MRGRTARHRLRTGARHLPRPVARVVRRRYDEAVLFRRGAIGLDDGAPARGGMKTEEQAPGALRRIRRGEIQRVTLRRVAGAFHFVDDLSAWKILRLCARSLQGDSQDHRADQPESRRHAGNHIL